MNLKNISTTAPAGHSLAKTRARLPLGLFRKAKSAARKEGISPDVFIGRSIALAPYNQPAPMLSDAETRRLEMLAGELRTSPAKTIRAILLNALGYPPFLSS